MKTTFRIAAWSMAIIMLLCVSCSKTSTVTEIMADNGTATRYTDRGVTADQINDLIEAATSVPSIRDVSQWQFIAVGKGYIGRLASIKTLGGGIANAPAAIVICGLSRRFNDGDARLLWQQDCAAAAQNIIITARSMGMTPNWIRVSPVRRRMADVTSALDLAPGVIPFAIITLGYADDDAITVAAPARQPETQYLGTFRD